MKSVALIGVPSDQTALGLIWYTTVCGLVFVILALVTTLVFSCGFRPGVTTNVIGQTWSMISCSTNSLSSACSTLKPATSSSSANVAEPPALTVPEPDDEEPLPL